ncbi:hypothetical protein CVT25_006783 [Psilocybe cyanescens]|uniref:Uncharacterized protein n=1 Tax=Psilocybe cyanescens TaxID=93625 RepID=A0A409X466_PSICY|nr:hypothetical protein CVT25_006783 [Psilocybe cyanescens]
MAKQVMNSIHPKWKPIKNRKIWETTLDLNVIPSRNVVEVDADLPHMNHLADVFRVFTKPGKRATLQPKYDRSGSDIVPVPTHTAHIGSFTQTEGESTIGGAGLIFEVLERKSRLLEAIHVPKVVCKHPDGADLSAVKLALNLTPNKAHLTLSTTSRKVFNAVTRDVPVNEDSGYLDIPNSNY